MRRSTILPDDWAVTSAIKASLHILVDMTCLQVPSLLISEFQRTVLARKPQLNITATEFRDAIQPHLSALRSSLPESQIARTPSGLLINEPLAANLLTLNILIVQSVLRALEEENDKESHELIYTSFSSVPITQETPDVVLQKISKLLDNRLLLLHIDEVQLFGPNSMSPVSLYSFMVLWAAFLHPIAQQGHLVYLSGRCSDLVAVGMNGGTWGSPSLVTALVLPGLEHGHIFEILSDLFRQNILTFNSESDIPMIPSDDGIPEASAILSKYERFLHLLSSHIFRATRGVPRFVYYCCFLLSKHAAQLCQAIPVTSCVSYSDFLSTLCEYTNRQPRQTIAPFTELPVSPESVVKLVLRLAAFQVPIIPTALTSIRFEFTGIDSSSRLAGASNLEVVSLLGLFIGCSREEVSQGAASSAPPTKRLLHEFGSDEKAAPSTPASKQFVIVVPDIQLEYLKHIAYPIFYTALLESPVLCELFQPTSGRLLESLTKSAFLARFDDAVFAHQVPLGQALPFLNTSLVHAMTFPSLLRPRRFPKVLSTKPKPAGRKETAMSERRPPKTLTRDGYTSFEFEPAVLYVSEPQSCSAEFIVCGAPPSLLHIQCKDSNPAGDRPQVVNDIMVIDEAGKAFLPNNPLMPQTLLFVPFCKIHSDVEKRASHAYDHFLYFGPNTEFTCNRTDSAVSPATAAASAKRPRDPSPSEMPSTAFTPSAHEAASYTLGPDQDLVILREEGLRWFFGQDIYDMLSRRAELDVLAMFQPATTRPHARAAVPAPSLVADNPKRVPAHQPGCHSIQADRASTANHARDMDDD